MWRLAGGAGRLGQRVGSLKGRGWEKLSVSLPPLRVGGGGFDLSLLRSFATGQDDSVVEEMWKKGKEKGKKVMEEERKEMESGDKTTVLKPGDLLLFSTKRPVSCSSFLSHSFLLLLSRLVPHPLPPFSIQRIDPSLLSFLSL